MWRTFCEACSRLKAGLGPDPNVSRICLNPDWLIARKLADWFFETSISSNEEEIVSHLHAMRSVFLSRSWVPAVFNWGGTLVYSASVLTIRLWLNIWVIRPVWRLMSVEYRSRKIQTSGSGVQVFGNASRRSAEIRWGIWHNSKSRNSSPR